MPRQFIFRMKEFEQMEMEFFCRPGTEMEWFAKWKENRMKWHVSLGMGAENYRFHDHEKLAHYANAATDIEFNFPFGFKELEGIHSRTDFDLGNHQKISGKKIQYFDPETGESYVPYCVETSIGVDRMFLAILSHSYCVEVAGPEHVGIGSDFDGGGGVLGCNGDNDLINLTVKMLEHGYSPSQIEGFWGGNFMRVMKEVQSIPNQD